MSGRASIGRRRFLQALAVAGTSAVLAACGEAGDPAADSAPLTGDAATPRPSAWFKDTTPFMVHDDGKSLEARLENMDALITPGRFFFVRNNSVSLEVDADAWQLSIEGDAVANPRTFTYDDIRRLPSRTLVCYLECAGNHRAMFGLVQGRQAKGTQWMTGGVSNGEWVGVPLREVLISAGITEDAVTVLLIGLDTESPEQGFRRVLPVAKALHPDTLLAYSLNGDDLPRDHGYPLRALVPGWVGSSNVKWLGRIVVSKERLWTRNNTTSYVLIGDDYAPEGQALGKVATNQVIKSALAPALAGAAERRAAPDPRLRALARRPDSEGRMEPGFRADLARRRRARAPNPVLVGAICFRVGRAAGQPHRHDPRHRRRGQDPAGPDPLQREGLPLQSTGPASG